jgi:hypothetical protein
LRIADEPFTRIDMNGRLPTHFSDEQARAILARAIEIDSRAPTTTTDDLRAIAADIGVSPAALEAALREQTIAIDARGIVASRRAATTVAAAGVPLGLVAGWLLGSGADLATLALTGIGLKGVGLIASGGLVVLQGATGTLRSFHLRNSALWAGIAAGSLASIALLGGGLTTVPALMTAGWCLRSWITSGVLGSAAVLAIRRARRLDGPGPEREIVETAPLTRRGRWARVAKQVVEWITRPPRRDVEHVGLPSGQLNSA